MLLEGLINTNKQMNYTKFLLDILTIVWILAVLTQQIYWIVTGKSSGMAVIWGMIMISVAIVINKIYNKDE